MKIRRHLRQGAKLTTELARTLALIELVDKHSTKGSINRTRAQTKARNDAIERQKKIREEIYANLETYKEQLEAITAEGERRIQEEE